MNKTKFKGVHFYWSQKKIENAEKFYAQYASEGSVILDPFLGGGSSLYAIRDKKVKFIGNDINELPISIAKFNCNKVTVSDIKSLNIELQKLKDKLGYHYEYLLGNKKVVFSKVVFLDLLNLEVGTLLFNKNLTLAEEQLLKNDYRERYIRYSKDIELLPNQNLITNSRIAIKKGMKMSDIFSPITFRVLTEIKNFNLSEDFKFVLASCLHLCRLTDTRSQSQFPFWIPKKNVVERNIFDLIEKKIGQLKKQLEVTSIKRYRDFDSLISSPSGALLLNKPTQKISEKDIPNNSVNLIFTDPPYFDQIAYSEYLKIWEFFVGKKSFLKNEIVVSQRSEDPSNLEDYIRETKLAFKVLHKKLRFDGRMAIYFKDSRMDKVGLFLKVMQECNFDMDDQIFISSKKYTYKQNTTVKSTIKGDSIFVFSKGKDIPKTKSNILKSEEEVIKNFTKKYLVKKKRADLGELYHGGLVKELFNNNCIDSLSSSSEIIKIIEKICKYDEETREYSVK